MSGRRRAVATFRGRAAAHAALHTRLRWWWCPFPVIESAVPDDGDVLEVGCGHGLLSPVPRARVAAAPCRRRRHRRRQDRRGQRKRPDGCDPGEADVSFEAVECRLRPGRRVGRGRDRRRAVPAARGRAARAAGTAAASALRPGGVLVVKEMGLRRGGSCTWNRAQETLATRVFRVTDSVGRGLTFVEPERMASWLAGEGLDVIARRDRPRLPVAASLDRRRTAAHSSCDAARRRRRLRRCSRAATAGRRRPEVRTRTARAARWAATVRRVEAVEREGHDAGTSFVGAIATRSRRRSSARGRRPAGRTARRRAPDPIDTGVEQHVDRGTEREDARLVRRSALEALRGRRPRRGRGSSTRLGARPMPSRARAGAAGRERSARRRDKPTPRGAQQPLVRTDDGEVDVPRRELGRDDAHALHRVHAQQRTRFVTRAREAREVGSPAVPVVHPTGRDDLRRRTGGDHRLERVDRQRAAVAFRSSRGRPSRRGRGVPARDRPSTGTRGRARRPDRPAATADRTPRSRALRSCS